MYMATIALYANTVNLMPELIQGMTQSLSMFNSSKISPHVRFKV